MKVFGLRPALAMGILLFACLLLGFILMPVTSGHPNWASPQKACMSNMKQVGLGHIMYTADYDFSYPPVDWKPAIEPYVHNRTLYRCPEVSEGSSGYAYNQLLAGRRLPEPKGLEKVAMLFESNDLRPGAVGARVEPLQPKRHGDRLNLVLADGHAKGITFLGIRSVQMDPIHAEKQ